MTVPIQRFTRKLIKKRCLPIGDSVPQLNYDQEFCNKHNYTEKDFNDQWKYDNPYEIIID